MEKELTLNGYIKFARKIANKYKRGNDEECVSAIVYRLVIAYKKFNGLGNIGAYMYRMGDYACKSYLYKLRPERKPATQPLNDSMECGTNVVASLIQKETLARLPEAMTEREVKIVTDFYLSSMTLEAIGKEHGITKERVRQIIKRAISKARAKLNDE